MSTYCRIQCLGLTRVPLKNWITTTPLYMHRLIYVLGGEGGYIYDNQKFAFKKDHLYLIPGFANISTYSSFESTDKLLYHSYTNFEILPPIISKSVFVFDPKSDDGVNAALNSFNTTCDNCKHNNVRFLEKEELDYHKSTVIYLVKKMLKKHNVKEVEDPIILKSLEIMHKNLHLKTTISEIANQCAMSTDGFIRRFSKTMGETPYSYLKKLKLRTAQSLIDSGATLEEAAAKCAYSDATTLSHAISNMLKIGPHFR